MKIVILALMIGVGCAGCSISPVAERVVAGGQQKLAETADDRLEYHEWGLCDAPSTGAVRRRYGADVQHMALWRGFCAMRHINLANQPNPSIPEALKQKETIEGQQS